MIKDFKMLLMVILSISMFSFLLMDQYSFVLLPFIFSIMMGIIFYIKKVRLRYVFIYFSQVYFFSIAPYFDIKFNSSSFFSYDDMKINTFYVLFYFVIYSVLLISFTSDIGRKNLPANQEPDVKAKKYIWFLLCISLFSLLVYANIYGGIMNLLKFGSFRRQNIIADSSLLFVSRFITFANITTWLYITYFFMSKKGNKKEYLVYSILSFLIFGINVFSGASRQSIISQLITLIYIYFSISKKKFSFKKIVILFLFVLIIIWVTLYGKSLFSSIAIEQTLNREKTTLLSKVIKINGEFLHPYRSISYAHEYSRLSLRFFVDYVIGLMNLLPKRLLGFQLPPPISNINTINIFHVNELFYPPGFVAFSIYNLGIVGLLINTIIFTILQKYVFRVTDFLISKSVVYVGFEIQMILFLVQSTMSADPYVYFKSYFTLFVFLMGLYAIEKGSKKKYYK